MQISRTKRKLVAHKNDRCQKDDRWKVFSSTVESPCTLHHFESLDKLRSERFRPPLSLGFHVHPVGRNARHQICFGCSSLNFFRRLSHSVFLHFTLGGFPVRRKASSHRC